MTKSITGLVIVAVILSLLFCVYPVVPQVKATAIHLPIRINSDSDFALQGFPGNGTMGNPWFIEGLEIPGNGKGDCIFIGNTTDYFIIENCSLHDSGHANSYPGSSYSAGLLLSNVTAGMISNNTVHSNYNGICLESTSNVVVTKNIITNNTQYGVFLDYSANNTIFANNIFNNNDDAIDMPIDEENGNFWDGGYPLGGNYWTPDSAYYPQVDYYSGPNQDLLGADGFVEFRSYQITYYSADNYPLLHPIDFIDATAPISEVYISSQNTSPLGIAVETSDPDIDLPRSGIASVKLWYRYSRDNVSFGEWIDISDTVIPPDNSSTFFAPGWYWKLNYPEGEGYYQIHSKAIDVAGNIENKPFSADASCIYDITDPISSAGDDAEAIVGVSTSFDSADSYDYLGLTNYTWTFVYNHTQITLYGPTPEFTFWAESEYNITLNVTDPAGNWDTDYILITVTEEEPILRYWWAFVIVIVIDIIITIALVIRHKKKHPPIRPPPPSE